MRVLSVSAALDSGPAVTAGGGAWSLVYVLTEEDSRLFMSLYGRRKDRCLKNSAVADCYFNNPAF